MAYEKREMPADFPQNAHLRNAELRRMYNTSDSTLERWQSEVILARIEKSRKANPPRK